ncbi:MAG TPA: calcium-binding protein [Caulobacteraceae bacterium]|jgi:Ca2+-binding RTX toxin-like protein
MTTITGTSDSERLTGGAEDDLLQGLEGDDTLDGGGGANTLEGGLGNDVFHINSLGDSAVETDGEGRDTAIWTGAGRYVLAANVEDLLVLEDATEGVGNELANRITAIDFVGGDVIGANAAVSLDGAGGNDEINGSSFDDTIFGGAGNDQIDGAGGGDVVHAGEGDDYVLGESFSFGDGWDDRLFGDAGNDLLDGLDGNDTLDGGDGADVMLGYAGDDRYKGGAGADLFEVILSSDGAGADVVEDFADGEDRILLALDGIEEPDMSAVTSIEQDGADTLITFVEAGTIRLLGVDASLIDVEDFFFYQDGSFEDDTLQGGAVNDLLKGETGNDRLSGLSGRDELRGGRGADRLVGGDGTDLLIGGAGHDLLRGGKGADTFRYEALSDRGDTIRDFHAGQGDLIDLSALDANSHKPGDQAFHFVEAFTGHAGEALLDHHPARDLTILRLDVDGDGRSDFALKLQSEITSDSGWVL